MNGRRRDVRIEDVLLGLGLAAVTFVAAAVGVGGSRSERGEARPVPGSLVAVRVNPVVVGGGSGSSDAVAVPGPSADSQVEPSAASPPSATRPRKPRGTHGASARARNDAPESAPVEAAAADSGEPNGGAPAEVDASTDGTGGEGTSGELGGEGGSGGDSLQARALAAYRERLIRWFSARFHVRGSGLGSALLSLRARAEVEISEGGVVLGYRVLSADHPALEAAAREALDAVLGEPLPPPPDFFPGAPQRRLRITFVCTESTCD